MDDQSKIKRVLIQDLASLRQRISELELSESERKLVEDELRESEEKYRSILENIEDGYFEVDRAGDFTFFNPSLCRILGYTREEMLGMNYRVLMDTEKAEKVFQAFNEIYVTGIPIRGFEWETIRKDGARTYTEVSVSLIVRPGEKPTRFRGIVRDITERKQAEEAIRESEKKYCWVLDNMADVITVMDMNLRFTYVSPSIMRMRGYTAEEATAQTFEQVMTPESLQVITKVFEEEMMLEASGTADPGRSRILETEQYRKDGSIVCMENHLSFMRDEAQKAVGIISLTHDVTARKQVEETLRESEELFRSYLENAPDGIYMNDLEGTFLYGNRKCEEITGYRSEKLIGKNFLEFNLLSENSLNKAAQLLQANIDGKSTGPDEIELISKEGRLIPVEINTNVVQRRGQRIIIASVRDITDRKRAEEKLALNFETQAAMNALLGLSIEGRTVKEFLYRALDLVLSLKWLAIESKGAIFLVDKVGETLHLQANKGFSKELCAMCSTVPFGRCLCGRAAAARAVQFADRVDERHDIRYEGMPSHGHYCVPILSGDHILGVINLYVKEGHTRSPWEEDFLKAVANALAGDIERKQAEEQLQQTLESLRKAVGTTIQVMASAVEARDPYTAGHQIRSADLARAIASEMGISQDKIGGIRMAGSIHDIGKLSIPAEILSKPTKLSEIEFSLIKEHARKGYEMLKNVESPWPLAEIVYQHHERMDGSGYPRNLKGDDILMEARILSVADVVEAMASHRPYRAGLGIDAALNEIEKNRGIFYDSTAADACLRLFREKDFKLEGT